MSDSEMHRPGEGAFRSAHAPYELTHPARQESGAVDRPVASGAVDRPAASGAVERAAAGPLELEGELSGASYLAWNRANLERMVTARHLPQDVIERARQKLRELDGEVPSPPQSDPPQLPPITIYSMLSVYD